MPSIPASSDLSPAAETPAEAGLLDALQHQVAVFARRAEQTRLGGVGQARNSMDRAAYLLLNRLDLEGPMGVKALAGGMGIDSSTVTRQVAPSSTPAWSSAPPTPRTAGPWSSRCPRAGWRGWRRCVPRGGS